MKRRVYIAGGVALALVAAFVGGRYSAPTKIVEKVRVETKKVTVTQWKDRVVEKKIEGPVREVERIVEKPGAERVVTRWIERGPVSTDTTSDASGSSSGLHLTESEASKVTQTGRPGWRVSVAAGLDLGAPTLRPEVYEGRLERRLVGTIWLGAWARTDRTAGVSVGMEF